jgi:hypothetical protein
MGEHYQTGASKIGFEGMDWIDLSKDRDRW